MTRGHGEAERRLADAVDAAIPDALRREWDRHVAQEQVVVGRQGIFSPRLHPFGYELAFRVPGTTCADAAAWSDLQHERATSAVLRATFGRADVDEVGHGRWLFVRCPRAYLVGDLQLPSRPDRLVIEIAGSTRIDGDILRGVRRLREQGFRIAMAGFVSRPDQRSLLPQADFVKIDARDLDVEGEPVVDLARSHGALLVAEFVESSTELKAGRRLGFDLYQGNLLERSLLLDRSSAPLIGPDHDSIGRYL
ncbi:EAL domain-containing protein [Cellulomonas endometrii]|jgi:EAL and modified HD-GYP domain-containing signal transduction protein|uniref:EAL domain-containing protein n=1 Tax=Cellulomonas endometrii TaxID=3036301 RepID=UPI0024ACA9A4|nr:EAL domain-containing protein [Cellulomonas endometrii]